MTAATTPDERWSLGYRPELDGVRGAAILLVIGGHLRIPGIDAGGVSGVTLFFVLSGFLITTLLLEEQARTGSISIRAFYRRRALRLLPALAAVLVAVGLVRAWLGTPETLRDVSAVALYVANWSRIVSGDLAPGLDHMWSLAVEEQFYIAWPLLLIGLLALGRGRVAPIVTMLLLGAAVSAALRVVLPLDRAYLGTDSRADALLIGSAIGVVFHTRGPWAPPGWLVWVAAIAILAVSAPTGDDLVYRLKLVLGLPVVTAAGVVLIAAAVTHGAQALAFGPLAGIGKVSYGLYLWHVPVLIATSGADRWVQLTLVAAVTLASYHLVERPFLRMRHHSGQHGAPGRDNGAPRAAVVAVPIAAVRRLLRR